MSYSTVFTRVIVFQPIFKMAFRLISPYCQSKKYGRAISSTVLLETTGVSLVINLELALVGWLGQEQLLRQLIRTLGPLQSNY